MKTSNRYGATVDVTPVLETHEVVVPAASASTDSAVLVTLSAAVGDRAENGLVLEWIGAQGIIPTDLRIIVDGKDWRRAVVPLPPSLTAEVGALGEGDHGVQVELRNRRQSDVTVVLGVRGDANARTDTLTGAALGTVLPDVGARPDPVDRDPVAVSFGYQGQDIGFHAETTRSSYTVPAAKKARASLVAARVKRQGTGGGGMRQRTNVVYTASGSGAITWLTAEVYADAPDNLDRGEVGGALDLLTGDVVAVKTKNDGTDAADYFATVHLMTFAE